MPYLYCMATATTTKEIEMTTTYASTKEAAKKIIATNSTEQITKMLIENVRKMQSFEVGTDGRSDCYHVNMWLAEVLEDRIGVEAVEKIEDDLWKEVLA